MRSRRDSSRRAAQVALAAAFLAGCSPGARGQVSNGSVALPRPSGGSPDQPPTAALLPGSGYLGERLLCIDRELARRGLNQYGDPMGTTYANGSPLWDESTGTFGNRYDHVVKWRADIATACSRAPGEPER